MIENSLGTLYALEAISMIELYNDLDFRKYDASIISNIFKIYNTFPLDVDVSKFCSRCGKFGHEALRTCNECQLFDGRYEKPEDKVIRIKREDYEIRRRIQTKTISERRFNNFISQQNNTILKEFQFIESSKIRKENQGTSYVTTFMDEQTEIISECHDFMLQENKRLFEEFEFPKSNICGEERYDFSQKIWNIENSNIANWEKHKKKDWESEWDN
jgi:hypothetical protein